MAERVPAVIEPPHLSVFVLPGVPQDVALIRCWDELERAGCTFSGDVVVTRSDSPFRSVTDVERDVISYRGAAALLVREHRVLAVGLRHARFGAVSLSVASTRDEDERHPLEIAVHAGGLAFPVALRSRGQKADARTRWRWAKSLLVAASLRTEAEYGAAGVEAAFPSSRALGGAVGQRVLRPSTWFVPASTDDRAADERVLAALPPSALSRGPAGVLVRGPGADGEGGVSEDDVDRVLALLARRAERVRRGSP